jgi:hypothetical protein
MTGPAAAPEMPVQPQPEPIQQAAHVPQQPLPQTGAPPMAEQTGIWITCKKQFGQFLIRKPPTIILNDTQAMELVWKQACFVPISPGVPTMITVQFHYMGKARGAASTTVQVSPGQVAMFSYKTPIIMYSAGKLVYLG